MDRWIFRQMFQCICVSFCMTGAGRCTCRQINLISDHFILAKKLQITADANEHYMNQCHIGKVVFRYFDTEILLYICNL